LGQPLLEVAMVVQPREFIGEREQLQLFVDRYSRPASG
jgi:hypothetical protein